LANSSRAGLLPYVVAVFVTVLWASSYVLIKWGLQEVPPLFFATLRYALAFVELAVASMILSRRRAAAPAPRKVRSQSLILAGACGYTIAQGFQYVGLFFLPAVSTAFILTFNPIFVLVIGVAFLGEAARGGELVGLLIALAGALVFFFGRLSLQGEWLGVLITIVSGIGWAAYVIMVRGIQRERSIDSLRLTTITMGIGVAGLVLLTLATGEFAILSLPNWIFVVWLATANTALAFFLWNWALTSIRAYHLTVLQNVMLVEIAVLSFVFLDEAITPLMIVGLAAVLLGVVMVQLRSLGGRTGGHSPRDEAATDELV